MDQATKDAVKERLSLGYTEEKIINELMSAGYPKELAAAVYKEVTEESQAKNPVIESEAIVVEEKDLPEVTENTISNEVVSGPETDNSPQEDATYQSEAVESSKEEDEYVPFNRQFATSKKTKTPVIIGIVALVLLISGLIYGVAFGGFSAVKNLFDSMFSSAPYATEGEMVSGLMDSVQQMKAFSFNSDYEVKLEPRSPDTPVLEDRDLAELSRNGLPAEGNLSLVLSGLIDTRDKENPEFDVDVNMNALMEPFAINLGGSVRLTEGNLYGKVTDLPGLFEANLPFEIPLDTWLLLMSTNDNPFIDNMDIPLLREALESTRPVLTELSQSPFANLLLLGSRSAVSDKFGISQMASGVQALGLQTSGMSDKQKQTVEVAVKILKENPPIKFVSGPTKMKIDGETVYEYGIDLDYDNIVAFGEALVEETNRLYNRKEKVEDLIEVLPTREKFDTINELVDIRFNFRSDGTIQKVFVGSVFVPGSEQAKAQVNMSFATTYGRQNDAINISIPENIHPVSIKDMVEEKEKERKILRYDASMMQELSNMRSYAEISYNSIGYTYEYVCSDLRANKQFTVAIECFAKNSEYMIYSPFLNKEGVFCVDSTGAAVSLLVPPDANTYECKEGSDVQVNQSPTVAPLFSSTSNANPTALLVTNYGIIKIELFADTMPITTANFIKLAKSDFYDGVKFHRVIDGFMIQSGDPLTKGNDESRYGTGGPGYAIQDEFVSGPLLTNIRGTISMANSGPNSGGSQFFINLVDNTGLDFDKQPLTSKHPVFGRVTGGMDVVYKIGKVETSVNNLPIEDVLIKDIIIE